MSAGLIALIVVVVVAALLVIAALAWWDRRRSRRLQQRFGPEYDRTLESADSSRQARRELQERVARREQLDIRDLPPAAAARYQQQWADVQQQFVDEPANAVSLAHRLVTRVMAERGYPTEDADERTDLLSVDHADVVARYRSAADIEARSRAGRASTEDLRQAMQHYRALFDRLLGDSVDVVEPEESRGRRL